MAELTLRLRVDPETGKRHLVIDYESDEDALPMEHEEDHRRLVRAVVGAAAVEREGSGAAAEAEADQAPERRALTVDEG